MTDRLAALEARISELDTRLEQRGRELDIQKLQHLCGFLLDHPQLQDIINVAPDGVTAFDRARSMMQAERHQDYTGGPDNPMLGKRQWWEGGIYENTYKKVDGVWRFHVLNYMPQWHADRGGLFGDPQGR